MKHHDHEIGFQYDILRWISNWERIVSILVDMLGCLLSLVSDGNWVNHRLLVSFVYGDGYHLDVSMVL